MAENKNIGGLWLNVKKGTTEKYLAGNIEINGEKVKIICFKNSFKSENAAAPDYRIFLSELQDSPPKTKIATTKVVSKPKPAQVETNDEDEGLL